MTHTKALITCCMLIIAQPFNAVAQEVPKDDWLKQMEMVAPQMFCDARQYFRQCFDVSAEECQSAVSSAMQVCVEKYKADVPEMLQQPQDGTRFGKLIGECAGTSYEVAMADKHTRDPICFDASRWQQ